MTHKLISPIDRLLTALSEEADSKLGTNQLISIEYEQVVPRSSWEGEIEVRTLKASSRICFLNATLTDGDEVIFKAGAVFKAIASDFPE